MCMYHSLCSVPFNGYQKPHVYVQRDSYISESRCVTLGPRGFLPVAFSQLTSAPQCVNSQF